MNQPSDEALKRMIDFLLKTSVPRILEREGKEVNENQSRRMDKANKEGQTYQVSAG